MAFYNTSGESGANLAKANDQATRQEKYVLDVLSEHTDGLTTDEITTIIVGRKMFKHRQELEAMYATFYPFDLIWNTIEEHYAGLQSIIISVRRSCHDLADAGKIVKTDEQRKSKAGRNNFVYRIT